MIRPAAMLVAVLSLGCAPRIGGPMLEARSGRVVEQDSGRAVGEADVFQVYWRKGRVGEPPDATALRWSQADADGVFRFDEAARDDRGGAAGSGDALEYGFYHPDFGLVRNGAPRAEARADLELRGRRLDEAGRRASALQLCGSRPTDAVHAGVAARHCGRGERPPHEP